VSRHVPEKRVDVDQAATNIENAIRDFVRHDTGFPLQQRRAVNSADFRNAESQDALILRVATASTEEIDRLISELQNVRDMLRREGERVNRDLASYARLNEHLMTGMKIISENLSQWKGAPASREQAIADFKLRWLGSS
jgi:hypothetical protein